jgi:hypothetical protein
MKPTSMMFVSLLTLSLMMIPARAEDAAATAEGAAATSTEAPKSEIVRGKKDKKNKKKGKSCAHCKEEKGAADHEGHGHEQHPNDQHEAAKQ